MFNAFVKGLLSRLSRSLPLVGAAAYLIYKNYTYNDPKGSITTTMMCVGAAAIFGMTAIALFITDDGPENLF